MRRLKEVDVAGKRVLVRADFNVPTDARGEILDDTRIRESLPTIRYLLKHGAKVIAMSHMGRPKGTFNEKYSLKTVAVRLAALLEMPVVMADDCIGSGVRQLVDAMQPGQLVLLENLRFHPEEEENNPAFSRELAELAELYINDAFGAAHRAHASIAGITQYIPSYYGFLMEKEVTMLRKILNSTEKPSAAIVGGAKVSDKLSLLENLIQRMDTIIIGGGMANTFLKAEGIGVGASLCEASLLEEAQGLMDQAADRGVDLLLPVDVVVADRFADEAQRKTVEVSQVPEGWMILDIGPQTVELYRRYILEAKTILWNGPMGVYEFEHFSNGTNEVARAVATADAVSVVGGGDSMAAIYHLGLQDQITHVSTGGGATLEFLEGKQLPGLINGDYLEQLVR